MVNISGNEQIPGRRKAAILMVMIGDEATSAILRELDADYARVRTGQFAAVADEWEEQCTTIGRTVTIRIGDRAQTGVAESLDSEGALLLRTQHGRLERIIGGDVTVEK